MLYNTIIVIGTLSLQAFGKGASNFLSECMAHQAENRAYAHLLVNFSPGLVHPVLKVKLLLQPMTPMIN